MEKERTEEEGNGKGVMFTCRRCRRLGSLSTRCSSEVRLSSVPWSRSNESPASSAVAIARQPHEPPSTVLPLTPRIPATSFCSRNTQCGSRGGREKHTGLWQWVVQGWPVVAHQSGFGGSCLLHIERYQRRQRCIGSARSHMAGRMLPPGALGSRRCCEGGTEGWPWTSVTRCMLIVRRQHVRVGSTAWPIQEALPSNIFHLHTSRPNFHHFAWSRTSSTLPLIRA